ncbi:DUF1223 domain-containing protein [Planktotalea sp.]|uniref:DUF1223 domain-containing protein n=1 Tax=Planktotalea sp. TaxID=2029877 RepID=UPI003D6B44F9
MNKLSALFTALWIGLSGAAHAQSQPVVIELFTSQGCSSCPPADALMHKLAARSDVIALSMHVDYWDYIGWKDEFGRSDNTVLQKTYAQVAGRRSVYTPQMIIGGVDSVVGTHPMDVADLISKHSKSKKEVALKVLRSGGKITIAATAARPAKYEVRIVNFHPQRTTAIKRGENAGKTITYVNVVSDFKVVNNWDGRAPLSLSVPVKKGPAAILIQRSGKGAIEAAATVN